MEAIHVGWLSVRLARGGATKGASGLGGMEALRKYDGWWYFADLKLPDRDPRPTAYTTVGTPRTSTEDLVSSVVWNAFRTCDSDRLEAALTNASLRDEPDSLVVHEQTGQRIAKVSFSTMTIEAIYWAMPSSPVRRAIWMQMKSSDYAAGGAPVPVEWEEILEEAYDQYTIWIASASSSDGVVEKMVSLWGALVSYVLILRRGVPDAARMVLAKALESSPPMGFSKKETIRLVRGYIPYYIAVTAAVKQVDGSAGRSSPSPMPAVLPSPFEAVDTSPGVAPKALLLAVHGIGQKLAGRYGHHFIRDCIKLKECILPAMTNKGGSANDLIVIPITWRRSVKMSTKYFAEYDGPEGGRLSGSPEISFEDLVASITLGNIPAIRNIASDVGLDILLYMTPIYFKRIIKATLAEVRRIYVLFRKFGGVGAAKTKVSFVGHSLGCAIISDLLSFVAEDLHKATVREKSRAVLSNLGFAVDKFFAMGSPLAIFFLLKHLKPVACFTDVPDLQEGESSEGRVRDAYPSLPEASAMDILEPRAVIFACREIYNIFNPNDPIAYRMEPLIVSPIEMKRYSYPVRLPSHKVRSGPLCACRQAFPFVDLLFGSGAYACYQVMHASEDGSNELRGLLHGCRGGSSNKWRTA